MSDREKLPDRRDGDLFTFDFGQVQYTAQWSQYEDGRVAEMFMNAGKEGSSVDVTARECAVIISIAVQRGVPIEELFAALPKLPDGAPAGPVGMAILEAMEH